MGYRSVGPGRDHATIQDAIAAVSASAPLTEVETIEVFAGTYAENVVVPSITGESATAYVDLRVAAADQHNGTAGTGVLVDPGGKGTCFWVEGAFTRITGFEITNSAPATSDEGIRVIGGDLLVDQCLIYDIVDDGGQSDGIYTGNWNVSGLTIRDTIIYGMARCGVHFQMWSTGTAYAQDATIDGCDISSCAYGIGYRLE
ncbi:MAG: hypothetical protein GY711_18955, partial [bacterium]|nr:hypothetical protein [bacterium]